jgi:hypothetical protein
VPKGQEEEAPIQRAARRCIFCGEAKVLTKEDLWPLWSRSLFIQPSPRTARREIVRVPGVGGSAIRWHRFEARPEDVTKRQVRAVCAECNNGWMSRLETAAEPILTEMMWGKRMTLRKQAQRTVACWAAVKTAVYECTVRPHAVIPEGDRRHLVLHGEPPERFRIQIAHHNDAYWWRGIHRYSNALTMPLLPTSGRKIIQSTSIGFGHILFYVVTTAANCEPVPISRGGFSRTPLLWPYRGPIAWPPVALSDEEVELFTRSLRDQCEGKRRGRLVRPRQ